MKRSDFDPDRYQSAEKLKVEKNFTPCPVAQGDEMYPNGIFVFNITKMLEFIKSNPDKIGLTEAAVADFPRAFSSVDESYLDSVDISQPVVLAEISPGRYNLVDGHHRMEKARRMEISHIPAYRLNVKQHVAFLTEKRAYVSYVQYWNEKVQSAGRLP